MLASYILAKESTKNGISNLATLNTVQDHEILCFRRVKLHLTRWNMLSYQSFSNSLLDELRLLAKTERKEGSYCERLAVAFFKNDAGWKHEFEDVWLCSD